MSGAAGLVYEIIWTRYLSLLLGHSALAQVLVLMIFLGGTALGALIVGFVAERLTNPLLLYCAAELAVALFGAGFHSLYGAVTGVAYTRIFPALTGGAAMFLVQWGLAAALIFPQSVLLGTTFPLMSAAIIRRAPRAPGRTLASLYFANGFGGAIGVVVGGFLFVGAFGLPGALRAGGALSGVAALIVLPIALLAPRTPHALRVEPEDGRVARQQSFGLSRGEARYLLLVVALGTAVASLAYEIAWTRMLSLVLGSATHAFELMLSAFILGMSLGALWLRRRADGFVNPLRSLGWVQVLMGACAIATMPLYLSSFRWTVELMSVLGLTRGGYVWFSFGRYALCLAIMLPATFCTGITLPLITRILLRIDAGEGSIGVVYAANTIGSIIGAAAAGLFLLPIIGVKWLLVVAAGLDMLLGVWVLAEMGGTARARVRRVLGPLLVATACLVGAFHVQFDRGLLSSGVFRTRRVPTPGAIKVLFYRDGRTATVSGTYAAPGTVLLATNGKVDASLDEAWLLPTLRGGELRPLSSDASTQTLLPLVALAHVPRAQRALTIGHGSGMSAHLLLGSQRLTSVTTLEIEPEMILGSNVFYPANRRVFDDPRSHFVVEDARSYLAARPTTRYDLMISEPSNPWVSGVSTLFSTEFYRLASSRLARGGVFVQWIQMYETSDEAILSILAAIHANFRSYALYQSATWDLLVVAGNDSTLPAPDWSVTRLPAIAQDMRNIIPLTPQELDALWLGNRATFAPLLDLGVQANSDFTPVLDLAAEGERYLGHTARGFATLASHRFDPFAALAGHRIPIGTEPVTATPEIERASAGVLAARLRLALDANHDTLPAGREYGLALLRRRLLDSFIAQGVAPPDWQLWMRNVAIVEHDVHGESAGAVDESFYAPIYRFMRARQAPAHAIAALDFMHGLAAWDFTAASKAADDLLADARTGEEWLPADMFLEGTVVAKLETGDVAGARMAYDELLPLQGHPPDLRLRLLGAQIRQRSSVGQKPSSP